MSALVWIRRDIRLHDHHALSVATKEYDEVHLCFCFDSFILNKLPSKEDNRLTFIIESLKEVEKKLNKKGASLHILYGNPIEEVPKLALKLKTNALLFNRDYEPYAKKRDNKVTKTLQDKGIIVKSFKDSVYFESDEVLSKQSTPYSVFTPYKRRWLEFFEYQDFKQFKINVNSYAKFNNKNSIINKDWHKELGFIETSPILPGGTKTAKKQLKKFDTKIDSYHRDRDFPELDGTSMISPYLRHGNISVRDCIAFAKMHNSEGADIWLSEIIWREFYHMILDHFPHVEKKSFKEKYDAIEWSKDKKLFQLWKDGQTGYPLIDAAMRYFKETGIMHNRLRMVVASFLCKILQIDWRWGEKYFAEKLLDFDLAANNGGWQWSSSSGCDAQPYFRIFNPYTQSEKFDAKAEFIKKHCPELKHIKGKKIHSPHLLALDEQATYQCVIGRDYPHPIVDYKKMREDTLNRLYQPVSNKK